MSGYDLDVCVVSSEPHPMLINDRASRLCELALTS